jgi:hypothetical protein
MYVNKLENYLQKYNNLEKKIIYDFNLINGGIGDLIKFFVYLLSICIDNDIKIHYLVNNIHIEKYLKLTNKQMYIKNEDVKGNIITINNFDEITRIEKNVFYFLKPSILYSTFSYDIIDKLPVYDLFKFSHKVEKNIEKYLKSEYISIHLRLGDKFLETDESYIFCKEDIRSYNERHIFSTIEENYDKNIIFFCDNTSYKLKIKNKYDKIIITTFEIGHTTLINTTDVQVLNSVSEFYLLTNSSHIYAASNSGFSIIASKFKNTPITYI